MPTDAPPLAAVNSTRVQNYDLTELIDGHPDYVEKMDDVM